MPFERYYIFTLLVFIPVVQIFRRAGFKPYWVGLLAVPNIGLALCAAALALRKWPKES